MNRTRHRQRRAPAGAGLAVTLAVVIAAAGGFVTSQPQATAVVAVVTGIANSFLPARSAAPPPVARAVVGGPHENGCRYPVTGTPGQRAPDARTTALLIGDSQSAGAAGVSGDRTWLQTGLRNAGYDVWFVGAGGTGFVAANGAGALSYSAALTRGQWVLPCSDPALIVVQGGGNDATQGATDEQIINGANALMSPLAEHYPSSRIVLVGTLAKGAAAGGGRRSAVDGLLGSFARSSSITFISAGDWLTRYQAGRLMTDGVHLTHAGHDRMAAAFTNQLHALHLTSADVQTSTSAAVNTAGRNSY